MANNAKHNEVIFNSGDLIKVYQTIKEKDKEKVLTFEGRVISIRGRDPNKSFTVRRLGIDNIGVERIFPLNSPLMTKIEVKKQIGAKRAKLYYLRGRVTKK